MKEVIQCGPATMTGVGCWAAEGVVARHAAGAGHRDKVVVLEGCRKFCGGVEGGVGGWECRSKWSEWGHKTLVQDRILVASGNEAMRWWGCGDCIFEVMECNSTTRWVRVGWLLMRDVCIEEVDGCIVARDGDGHANV